eukprot:NODE_3274_length_793_cov_117.420699_g2733_i0.p1 GENE.NODE_3274_length_793_cov_117.420699_g2733_i0~~NODE_3274_length_793_cov_117.420699_g2733_i0.p1  ORF type:complete len:123 (-),score=2.81 NODE_3274_length_793_cov_117.420699_g2733_i0:145-513(-)
MEVGISNIVLLPVSWESERFVTIVMSFTELTNKEVIFLNHLFLHVSANEVLYRRPVQMPNDKSPHESESVLVNHGEDFPIEIGSGILDESRNVLKCSPFLCIVSGLSCLINKLSEITITFFD